MSNATKAARDLAAEGTDTRDFAFWGMKIAYFATSIMSDGCDRTGGYTPHMRKLITQNGGAYKANTSFLTPAGIATLEITMRHPDQPGSDMCRLNGVDCGNRHGAVATLGALIASEYQAQLLANAPTVKAA